jgi:hypothetical protein
MGRLQKAVIDKIVKLRKDGFTQVEIADKLKVHIKSVQKYDPLRRPKRKDTGYSQRIMNIEDLTAIVKSQGDYIFAIWMLLQSHTQVDRLRCPNCVEGELRNVDGVDTCPQCGFKMKLFKNVSD